jgi:hypothetical protein
MKAKLLPIVLIVFFMGCAGASIQVETIAHEAGYTTMYLYLANNPDSVYEAELFTNSMLGALDDPNMALKPIVNGIMSYLLDNVFEGTEEWHVVALSAVRVFIGTIPDYTIPENMESAVRVVRQFLLGAQAGIKQIKWTTEEM